MNNEYLDLEVRLLVLRHGRPRVLESLARIGEQTVEQLEKDLATKESRRGTKGRKVSGAEPALMELVGQLSHDRPEIAESLRELVSRFQSRVFLPNLRDVQRLLDRLGEPHRTLKSRKATGPVVVRALAALPSEELRKIVAHTESANQSDFSLLAQAIMGTDSEKEQ